MRTIEYFRKRPTQTEQPYKEFGAPTQKEYEKWSPHICSICCLKSVGNYYGVTNKLSLYQLTKDALSFGVFRQNFFTGEISGAYHDSLIKFAESLGLQGKIEQIEIPKLIGLLDEGWLVLVSVDKSKIDSTQSGGHLLLVHTYNPTEQTFIAHDSEPILEQNGENIAIKKEYLNYISNKKGISLKK